MGFACCLVMSVFVSCAPLALAQDDAVELPAILTEHRPPRPELPEEVAAEVEEMEARIEEMRVSFLKGERESLDEAIELAGRVYEIRVANQAGWTDVQGNPAEWWEVGDARRDRDDLILLTGMTAAEHQSLDQAYALKQQAGAAWDAGDNERCAELEVRVLTHFKQTLGVNHPDTLNGMYNLAVTREELLDLESALSLHQECLEQRRLVQGSCHLDTLDSMSCVGQLLEALGRLTEAEPYSREALKTSRRVLGDDHLDTLVSISNMGALMFAQGKLSEAEKYYREDLAASRRVLGEDHPDALISTSNMGVLLIAQGKVSEAELFIRENLEASRRVLGDRHPDTLGSLNNLGGLLYVQGRFAEAEPCYREVLQANRRVLGHDHPETLSSISNMAVLLKAQGLLSEAELYDREALARKRLVLGDDHPRTLISIGNLGVLLLEQGRLSEAEPLIREALEARRRVLGDEHAETLLSIGNLGVLLQSRGKLSDAVPHYREALETSRRVLGNEHPSTLISINNMGYLLEAQGNLSQAALYYHEALRARRRVLGSDHPDTLTSLYRMGTVMEAQGKVAEAALLYREALEGAQRLRSSATGGERGRAAMGGQVDLRGIASALSNVLARRGELAEAWTITERARGRALLDLLARSESDLEAQFADTMKLTPAKSAETKARVALNVAESRLAATEKERAVIEGDASLDDASRTTRLSEFDQRLESQHDAILRARRDLGEATASVFLALQQVMPVTQPLTIEQIQSRLDPDDLLLGYTWSDDRVLLLSASHSHVGGAFVTECEEDTQRLTRQLEALRETWASRPERLSPPTESGLLVSLVPGAVQNQVTSANRVIILPDGPLTGIPFEAFGDPSILDDARQQIVYASSAAVYLNRRNAARKRSGGHASRLLALGDPIFDRDIEFASGASRGMDERIAEASLLDVVRLHGGTLPALPGTRVEAERIGELAGDDATVLVGEDATLANLEATVKRAGYVHIATHGLVGSKDRPYDASLALTRPLTPTIDDIGFLTLDHLIRNWRGKLESCDLVTLSACDTQRGIRHGDALMSLPWGFYYAGAPTVVASLWQIDDEATALLMTRFYENLLGAHEDERSMRGATYTTGDEMPKADALQEAKRWLRTYEVQERGVGRRPMLRPGEKPNVRRPYEHPYYWAAFVLIGDPG